ncbi:hypothetical protein KHS38_12000 [Mucilaginibacter sp. Bleaf8]|uniref:hypothetical protein n=1 Tax=Mucilaginibacter sp. Bleaf8 TaxID=2834430 RepID=UPI001BCD4928|nr:hypothetical protein [Mucilaginibacter sp. Bleaf8]MBS7565127.1 hypothetical protein [Mucilaginibacter sp. Bleaf8]
MDFSVEKVLDNVRVIDVDRKYRFIRSYSGQLYNDYYERNYIGLGLNKVPYSIIKQASKTDEPTFNQLRLSIKSIYDFKEGTVTGWANQLINFEHILKPGDMVIMPNQNSSEYAFGIVESETYLAKEDKTFLFEGKYEVVPEKRKKVKWLKQIAKDDLNGDLRGLSATHAAITAADDYSDAIEGHLSSLFIRDNRIFFTIKINQDEDINAFAFNDFLSGLTYFYKEYCEVHGFADNEQLYLKIKMQSRGKMALTALIAGGVVFVATLFALSDNPELKAELGPYKFDFKADGFLKTLSHHKNEDADKELERRIKYEKFRDSIDRLKANSIHNPVKASDEKEIHREIKRIHIQKNTVNNIQVIEDKSTDKDSTANDSDPKIKED